MFLVSSRSCLCSIHRSQVLSWEWRCSWSSADRRCSNYIWVINNCIAYYILEVLRYLFVSIIRDDVSKEAWLNSSPPGQKGHHFAKDIFRCIFMSAKFHIFIPISLTFVHKGSVDNSKALPEAILTHAVHRHIYTSWRGDGLTDCGAEFIWRNMQTSLHFLHIGMM